MLNHADPVSFGDQEAEVFRAAAVGYAGQHTRTELTDDYGIITIDCAR